MPSNDTIRRQNVVIAILKNASNDGIGIKDILDRLVDRNIYCSRKTIYRDIDDLSYTHGVQPVNMDGRGRWRMSKDFIGKTQLTFTLDELNALYLATDYFRGTIFSKDMSSAFEKIQLSLNKKQIEHISNLKNLFYAESFPAIDYNKVNGKIDIIKKAITDNKKVKIKYKSHSDESYLDETHTKSRPRLRIINPYQIYIKDNIPYVIAYCNLRQTIRIFAIHRIVTVKIIDEYFIKNKDFKLGDYLSEGFDSFRGNEKITKYKILFDKTVAAYVKDRMWHKSQKLKTLQDGNVIISIRVRGKKAVKRWVLGYGDKARILEPEYVAKEIKDELLKIVEFYT